MNKRLIIQLLLVISATSLSAQERADTVKEIENARNVLITRNGNTTLIDVKLGTSSGYTGYKYELDVKAGRGEVNDLFPDNWGMDLPFVNLGKNKEVSSLKSYSIGFRHLYWGWRFNYDKKGLVKNCFEVGIRDILGYGWRRGRSEFEIGLGFGMRRLLAADGCMYVKNGDRLVLESVAEGMEATMSRLDVVSFQVPLLYNLKMSDSWCMSIGGVVNFNTYAKAVGKTIERGRKSKNVMKGLHQNFMTPEILGTIYFDGVGFYGAWSPVALFKDGYGPEVKGWSIGVDFWF